MGRGEPGAAVGHQPPFVGPWPGQLVEEEALLRVVPGHPERSFLIDKLTGPGPDEGSTMPYTGSLLPSSQIEVIRTWIRQGARPD